MLSNETSIPNIEGINWRIWRLYAQFLIKQFTFATIYIFYLRSTWIY